MLLGDFGDAVAITVHVVYFSVFLYNAVPYIGFGFLDNFIMIVAVSPAANSRPLCQYYGCFCSSFYSFKSFSCFIFSDFSSSSFSSGISHITNAFKESHGINSQTNLNKVIHIMK